MKKGSESMKHSWQNLKLETYPQQRATKQVINTLMNAKIPFRIIAPSGTYYVDPNGTFRPSWGIHTGVELIDRQIISKDNGAVLAVRSNKVSILAYVNNSTLKTNLEEIKMKRIIPCLLYLLAAVFCFANIVGLLNNSFITDIILAIVLAALTSIMLLLTIDACKCVVLYYIRKHKKKKENKKQMKSKEIVLTVKFRPRKNPEIQYIQAFSSDIDLARCVVKAIDCAKQNNWIIYSMKVD